MAYARLSGAGTPFDWPEAIGFDRAPYASAIGGFDAFHAGPNGVAVGAFAWVNPDTGEADNVQTEGFPFGLVLPLASQYNLWERAYMRYAPPFPQMIVRPGVACVVAMRGNFSIKFSQGGDAGQPVYADPLTGLAYSGPAMLPVLDSNGNAVIDSNGNPVYSTGGVLTPWVLAQSGGCNQRLRVSTFINPFVA